MNQEKFQQEDYPDKPTEDETSETSVSEELKSVLTDPSLPNEIKEKVVKAVLRISVRKASSYRGPVPPPEILKGYNEVIANGAERIVGNFERQSEHRMQLENHAIREELKQSRLGQLFGFLLGLIGMGLATLLAILGHEAIAGIFGTTTIIGLVTVFVLGKRAQQKSLEEKS